MTEEDIKLNYITPALLQKGWQNIITMETEDQHQIQVRFQSTHPLRGGTEVSIVTIPANQFQSTHPLGGFG